MFIFRLLPQYTLGINILHKMLSFFTVIIACVNIGYAQGVVYDITTSTTNWQTILTNLKAGDTAIIHQGTYTTAGSGYFQLTLNGLLTKPIIIQGAPNEARPVIRCVQAGASVQNTINIQGSNFMIKGIAFTRGSRGVRLGPAGTFFSSHSHKYFHIFVFSDIKCDF